MNKNICTECGTENEEQFIYCKNCGAELKKEPQKNEAPVYQAPVGSQNTQTQGEASGNYSNYDTTQNSRNNGFDMGSIGGIPREEIELFIGRKANDIMPKFTKMEITQSKVSWCWPAAILGLIFGPIGSALWFFYRKMYKPAVILSVIGGIITLITTLLTVGTTDIDLEAFINAFASGNFDAALDSISSSSSIFSALANFIDEVSSIASCIVCGIFGYHIYKNHCVNKIHSFRNVQADQRYYRFGLANIGGVSGGMLALGIVIMLGTDYLASFISTLIAMIN